MIEFLYDSLKYFIVEYYKDAILFGIFICCIMRIKENLYSVNQKKNMLAVFFFAIYIYTILAITVLSRSETVANEVNLIPLLSFRQSEWQRMYFYVNMALFFPLPVFLYVLYPSFRKIRQHVFLGFSVSVLIEFIQYVFHCGWCDIDDVLSNTLGVILGWICIHGIYHKDRT